MKRLLIDYWLYPPYYAFCSLLVITNTYPNWFRTQLLEGGVPTWFLPLYAGFGIGGMLILLIRHIDHDIKTCRINVKELMANEVREAQIDA